MQLLLLTEFFFLLFFFFFSFFLPFFFFFFFLNDRLSWFAIQGPVSWRPTTVNWRQFSQSTVIPPSALDKPSIMKRYHRRWTCSHTSPRRSPTMVTLHATRFVECRWWNDGWTVKTVVTWRSSTVVGLHDTDPSSTGSRFRCPTSAREACCSNPGRGRNSSVGSALGSLSCVMQRRGFGPPLSLR